MLSVSLVIVQLLDSFNGFTNHLEFFASFNGFVFFGEKSDPTQPSTSQPLCSWRLG